MRERELVVSFFPLCACCFGLDGARLGRCALTCYVLQQPLPFTQYFQVENSISEHEEDIRRVKKKRNGVCVWFLFV